MTWKQIFRQIVIRLKKDWDAWKSFNDNIRMWPEKPAKGYMVIGGNPGFDMEALVRMQDQMGIILLNSENPTELYVSPRFIKTPHK